MDLRGWRCFVALADELHFGRAAAQLMITPSRMSQELRRLETELGLQLLHRTSRRVQLTAHGAALLGPARDLLSDEERLRQLAADIKSSSRGRLTIDYAPGLGELVSSVAAAFRQSHPAVEVKIKQRVSVEVAGSVRDRSASVGFATATLPELDVLRLAHVASDLLMTSPSHPLAAFDRVRIEQLAGVRVLVPTRRSNPTYHDATVAFFKHHGIEPILCPVDVTTREEVVDLVAVDEGVAFANTTLPLAPAREDVRVVPLDGPAPTYDVMLLWRAHDANPMVAEFVALTTAIAPRAQVHADLE